VTADTRQSGSKGVRYLSGLLPRDPFQRALFLLFLLFFAVSCISPPYLQFLLMQHVPTILSALLLGYLSNRFVISKGSFASIIAFLCLHTLGARYLYSYTPYDAWAEAIFHVNVSELFGFQRNHYDRVVHFSYGLLLVIPVQEFERRYLRLSLAVSSILAIEFIIATSASYEMLEWLVAVVFAPAWAEQFLGQQGDIFDAQKDTALATVGAILSVIIMALAAQRKQKSCQVPS
jgi:putative membrane protein